MADNVDYEVPQMKGITVAHLNCRSINKKQIQIFPALNNCDFIALTESWLTPLYDQALLQWDGKSYHRMDRNGHAGGIICYMTDKLFKYATVNEELSIISDEVQSLNKYRHTQ